MSLGRSFNCAWRKGVSGSLWGWRCSSMSSTGRLMVANSIVAGVRRILRRTDSGSRWGLCRWRFGRGVRRKAGCISSGRNGFAKETRRRRIGFRVRRRAGAFARIDWCCRFRRGCGGVMRCRGFSPKHPFPTRASQRQGRKPRVANPWYRNPRSTPSITASCISLCPSPQIRLEGEAEEGATREAEERSQARRRGAGAAGSVDGADE